MEDEEIKYFVRIKNTDLDGTKSVRIALTGLPGVGYRSAKIIADHAGVDSGALLGKLDEESVEKIAGVAEDYSKTVPNWLLNRQKDVYTGEGKQLFATEIELALEDDINRMRKIRCYRGIRHETGQKVRGQRTKSTGRTGSTVGVRRKKA
jgi:small subunit ribosomal protein S13